MLSLHFGLGREEVEKDNLGCLISKDTLILGQILNSISTLIMGRREYTRIGEDSSTKEIK